LEHSAEYEQMIEAKLQNYELDRVIGMDVLLMKMAICELMEFPDIPVKVTLNEYIDLSKYYSSDKSKLFINGILDKIIVDLRDQGKLNKSGRGLYQN
jgi:N utilization substance protein B